MTDFPLSVRQDLALPSGSGWLAPDWLWLRTSGTAPSRSRRRNLQGLWIYREANGSKHDVLQSGDKKRRIADGGHHPEDFDAKLLGIFARLNVDFVQRFDVF